MKKLFLLLSFCIFTFCNLNFLKAQNLVPNPSFEVYDTCPNAMGQIERSIGWSSFNYGSPEYYNSCANITDTLWGMPHNAAGYQQAATGNAYCGIICFATTFHNWREIIGCQLISPLQIGTLYYISFKANLSYGGYLANYIALNGMGAKFTTVQYDNTNSIPIDNSPTIYSSAIINDTLNWTLISGSFIADSAYQYIAIGNFFDDSHTDTLHVGWYIFRSYYYIDDVCVSNNTGECLVGDNISNIITKNDFFVYPNPAHNFINIKSTKNIYEINIYDAMGIQVYEAFNISYNPNGIYSINCSQFKNGIYFIKIFNNNSYITKKIIIN